MIAKALILTLTILTLACGSRTTEPIASPSPSTQAPIVKSPKERLIGHWASGDKRVDGSKCFPNDHFFQESSKIETFQIKPGGQVFRLDLPYRVVRSDETSVHINTFISARGDTSQSRYVFQDDGTLEESYWDSKKQDWTSQLILRRVDDKTEP